LYESGTLIYHYHDHAKEHKHAPTKGEERPSPAIASIDEIPVAIPIASNALLGFRENANGLNVARSNAVYAVHDEDSKT
jgi:hypothetical protein